MASNKTPNLGMDVWAETDFFKRIELNGNFTKLDTKAKENSDKIVDLSTSINDIAINTKGRGAKGDGTADETSIFSSLVTSLGVSESTILIPPGTFRFKQNFTFPENIKLQFSKGAKLSVDSGFTVTIKGEIIAGNHVIFTGSGDIDKSTSPTPYNVAWYEGVSLNKKWDKMAARFNDFIQKNIIVPKPYPNQVGAINPTSEVNRWYWKLDAPLTINDYCSLAKIYFEGELYAPTNIGTGVVFGLTPTKPETIHLPLGISVQGDSTNRLSIGIEVRTIARLIINGIVDVNNADKGMVIGGANHNGNIGVIEVDSFHCGFAKGAGIEIYGKGGSYSLNNILFKQVLIENNSITGQDAVVVKGATRQIKIASLFYLTNLGSNCKSVFVVQNTTEGTPISTMVDMVYSNNGDDYAVRTEDLVGGAGQVIDMLSISNVYTVGNGVSLYGTKSAFIKNVASGSAIYIDSTCIYTQLEVTNRSRSITDNGTLSVINGLGKRNYAVGATPDTTQWTIGNLVWNSSDNTVWVKVKETGVSANDFIKLN